jgi:hypothetical protein
MNRGGVIAIGLAAPNGGIVCEPTAALWVSRADQPRHGADRVQDFEPLRDTAPTERCPVRTYRRRAVSITGVLTPKGSRRIDHSGAMGWSRTGQPVTDNWFCTYSMRRRMVGTAHPTQEIHPISFRASAASGNPRAGESTP